MHPKWQKRVFVTRPTVGKKVVVTSGVASIWCQGGGGHVDDRGAESASVDAPNAPSGLGYGEGCSLPSRLGCLRERRELPQRCRGRSPGRYRIFRMF